MPNVPNVPGVPLLSSYSGTNTALLFSDGITALRGIIGAGWGVYLDGSPIITPATMFTQQLGSTLSSIATIASLIGLPNIVPVIASTIEFDYSADSPISNYPQESGAFQSYNKVQMPFDVKLKLGCSGSASQRQAFFDTLEALRTSTVLVDVVTPEKVFSGCNCKHIDYLRRGGRGVDLVIADAWFEEVREIEASTFSNTAAPGAAGQQSIGNVQPQTISAGSPLAAKLDTIR
jgi:hypothetical protein